MASLALQERSFMEIFRNFPKAGEHELQAKTTRKGYEIRFFPAKYFGQHVYATQIQILLANLCESCSVLGNFVDFKD